MKPSYRFNYIINGRFRFQNVKKLPSYPTSVPVGILCDKWKLFSTGPDVLLQGEEINESQFVTFYSNTTGNEFGIYQRNEGAVDMVGDIVIGFDVCSSIERTGTVEFIRRYDSYTESFKQDFSFPKNVKRKFVHFDLPDIVHNAIMENHDHYYEVKIIIKDGEENSKISIGNICMERGVHEELYYEKDFQTEQRRVFYYQQPISLFTTGIEPKIKIPYRMNKSVKTVTIKNDTGYFYDSPILISSAHVESNWYNEVQYLVLTANKYQHAEFKNQKSEDDYLVIIDGDL